MIIVENRISIEEIRKIIFVGEKIAVSERAQQTVMDSYSFLSDFRRDKTIYGINTGFGPMAQYRVDDSALNDLQYNIVRSHASGTGQELPVIYVEAALIVRVMTFLQGMSGVSYEVVESLVNFINHGICPIVPEHGSVGASGDLVQLAHIALALVGEGEVTYGGEAIQSKDVMRRLGIEPLRLKLRDGLALTNGTSVMTGMGAVNVLYAMKLFEWSLLSSAMVNEITESYNDFISPYLNEAKNHYGQKEVARKMRQILNDSKRLKNRETELYCNDNRKPFSRKVQSYYSLRCTPQILGPILDTITKCREVVENEINSASDNPIVDMNSKNVYHGGNFHGDYISFEMDKLKMAVTKLTMLNERQLNYLLHDKINEILPPFLSFGTLGLNYGMQGMQFTATSTTAENQMLSNSMYVHSIPNNNDNQDIVSMGSNSANIARRVIDNSFQVLAIHMIAICQAIDRLDIVNELSSDSRSVYSSIREICPVIVEDLPQYRVLNTVVKMLKKMS